MFPYLLILTIIDHLIRYPEEIPASLSVQGWAFQDVKTQGFFDASSAETNKSSSDPLLTVVLYPQLVMVDRHHLYPYNIFRLDSSNISH